MADYERMLRNFVKENTGQVMKKPRSFIRYPFIDPGSVYDGWIPKGSGAVVRENPPPAGQ